MNITEEQIEWVIQEVIRRLKATMPEIQKSESSAAGGRDLDIAESLVTTETLRNRLRGITTLRVARSAVVTPAVVDLLKDRKIQLVRTVQ